MAEGPPVISKLVRQTMSDQNKAIKEINKKWKKVRSIVGSKETTKPDKARHGGWVQRCKKGRIYYHPNTGAHEVHGGILKKYLQFGGPDFNPKTRKRDLGFPKTDEIRTDDGVCPYSEFEWGAIFWINGGVALYNPFYTKWKKIRKKRAKSNKSKGFPFEPFNSYPLYDPIPVARGLAVYYGLWCEFASAQTNNEVVTLSLENFPCLGAPWILKPQVPINVPWKPHVRLLGTDRAMRRLSIKKLVDKLWSDRIQLHRVGDPNKKFRLSITTSKLLTKNYAELDIHTTRDISDRTLHDIVFIRPGDGKKFVLFHHAAYVRKKDWKKFGLIHTTDLHISRRTEEFRNKLIQKGHGANAKEFVNYNDGFRDLIHYANHLHKRGDIDFIIATGDLIDFQYELYDRVLYDKQAYSPGYRPKPPKSDLIKFFQDVPENKRGLYYEAYNNFEFFLNITLGKVPDQRGISKAEELRVPIFAALGNHDYRRGPYQLHCKIPVLFSGKDMDHYESCNLIKKEAKDIQGGHKPTTTEFIAEQSVQTMVPSWPRNRIFPMHSYSVSLGSHQLVLLNSGRDLGIIDDIGDALKAFLDIGSDEQREFLNGRPRSEGLSDEDIKLVEDSLKNKDGLIIVGMHAGPMGTYGHPHYFRETEHPKASIEDIAAYLAKCPDNGFIFNPYKKGRIIQQIPNFLPVKPKYILNRFKTWNLIGTDYFMRGKLHKYLKKSIGVKNAEEFLKICTGQGKKRPIDLVLFGHEHNHVEYRVKWDQRRKELLYYMDFYTENPSEYYPSWKYGYGEPVKILPRKGVSPGGSPASTTDHRPNAKWKRWWNLMVPCYPDPLNSASDKRKWWTKHRPLLLETTSLGPVDNNQRPEENKIKPGPNLQGFRVVLVKDNLISQIHNVTLEELRKNEFKMPWEQVRRRPVLPRFPRRPGGTIARIPNERVVCKRPSKKRSTGGASVRLHGKRRGTVRVVTKRTLKRRSKRPSVRSLRRVS